LGAFDAVLSPPSRVLELCDRHWNATEFFVAKAIGWALRDLARLDREVVISFLPARPTRTNAMRP
jgi:3-methyladenine DNA glycosylase AlkD